MAGVVGAVGLRWGLKSMTGVGGLDAPPDIGKTTIGSLGMLLFNGLPFCFLTMKLSILRMSSACQWPLARRTVISVEAQSYHPQP